jgi:hypothetical protein
VSAPFEGATRPMRGACRRSRHFQRSSEPSDQAVGPYSCARQIAMGSLGPVGTPAVLAESLRTSRAEMAVRASPDLFSATPPAPREFPPAPVIPSRFAERSCKGGECGDGGLYPSLLGIGRMLSLRATRPSSAYSSRVPSARHPVQRRWDRRQRAVRRLRCPISPSPRSSGGVSCSISRLPAVRACANRHFSPTCSQRLRQHRTGAGGNSRGAGGVAENKSG